MSTYYHSHRSGYGSMAPCLHLITHMDMDMAPFIWILSLTWIWIWLHIHILMLNLDVVPCLHNIAGMDIET